MKQGSIRAPVPQQDRQVRAGEDSLKSAFGAAKLAVGESAAEFRASLRAGEIPASLNI